MLAVLKALNLSMYLGHMKVPFLHGITKLLIYIFIIIISSNTDELFSAQYTVKLCLLKAYDRI